MEQLRRCWPLALKQAPAGRGACPWQGLELGRLLRGAVAQGQGERRVPRSTASGAGVQRHPCFGAVFSYDFQERLKKSSLAGAASGWKISSVGVSCSDVSPGTSSHKFSLRCH